MPVAAAPGRRKLEWVHITPEEIQNFREERELSRSRLAAELGVSPASVLNWEKGKVASMACQQRLAALVSAGEQGANRALGKESPSKASALLGRRVAKDDSHNTDALGATVSLVSKYVEIHGANLAPADFVGLIRSVKQALKESDG